MAPLRAAAAPAAGPRRARRFPRSLRAADGPGRAAGARAGPPGPAVPGRAGGVPLPPAALPGAAAPGLDVPALHRHVPGSAGHHAGLLLPAELRGVPVPLLVPAAAGQNLLEQPLLPLRAAGLPAGTAGRRPLRLCGRALPAPEAERPRASVELHSAACPGVHRVLHRGAEEAGRRLGRGLLHGDPRPALALCTLQAGAVGGADQPAGGARRGAGARPLRRLPALLRRHAAPGPRLRHLLPLHELPALQHRHVLLHHAGHQRALLPARVAPGARGPLPPPAAGLAAQHKAPPAQPRLPLRGPEGPGGPSASPALGRSLHHPLRAGAALPALLPLHHPGLQQLDQRALRLLVGHDGALPLPPARQDHLQGRAHRGGGLPQTRGVHAEPALAGPRRHAEAVLGLPEPAAAALQRQPAPDLLRRLGVHQRALPAEACGPPCGPGACPLVPVDPHAVAAAAARGSVAVAPAAAGAGGAAGRTHGHRVHRRLPGPAPGELRERGPGEHEPAGAAGAGAGGAGGAAAEPLSAGGSGDAAAGGAVPQGAHGVPRALVLHVPVREHHGAGAGAEPDAAAGAAGARAQRHRRGPAAPRAAAPAGGAPARGGPSGPAGVAVPAAGAAPAAQGAPSQPGPAPAPLPPQEVLPLPPQCPDDADRPAEPGAGPPGPGAPGTGGGLRQLARGGGGGSARDRRGGPEGPRALNTPNKCSFVSHKSSCASVSPSALDSPHNHPPLPCAPFPPSLSSQPHSHPGSSIPSPPYPSSSRSVSPFLIISPNPNFPQSHCPSAHCCLALHFPHSYLFPTPFLPVSSPYPTFPRTLISPPSPVPQFPKSLSCPLPPCPPHTRGGSV